VANIRQVLYAWRDQEAAKRAVELFRILPNSALDEIVKALPRTKEELTAIKGIKDAKYHLFGKTILGIIDEYAPAVGARPASAPDEMHSFADLAPGTPQKEEESVYSVGAYLDIVNNALWRLSARVKGEVTSVKFQGSAVYMGIKDARDESVMNVFMWTSDYALAGIEIAEGLEVIVEGKSEIYKPSGRFNFRAHSIELVGEGALKKAYDVLKKKLDAEGVFAVERKRTLPEYPERIGLITSKTGAVIHDFLNNLGKFGFKVRLTDARVEGASAIRDILAAIAYFKDQPIDALVIVRGGGSLESLQAFNNELVVRAIAEFPKPVLCAIGHDKDVPLAQLAADYAPSTPTACTAILNYSWAAAVGELNIIERDLMRNLGDRLWEIRSELQHAQTDLSENFAKLFMIFRTASESVRAYVPMLDVALVQAKKDSEEAIRQASARYYTALQAMNETLKRFGVELETHNPLRQLKLGYSILSQGGKVLRSVAGRRAGEHFEARLADGTLSATITDIISK
jgi:exodeoxyribonuclease VII large subunit